MNHSGDANKMVSDTPRTTDRVVFIDGNPWVNAPFARGLERELNAANQRIQSLIEERDRANRLAEWKWNLRDEFELLLGTSNIEEGIEAVKELKRRIKRLEEFVDQLTNPKFTRDDLPKEALLQRIKRLEEAGQRVDDAAHSIQDWSGTVLGDALDELNKAKEAKP